MGQSTIVEYNFFFFPLIYLFVASTLFSFSIFVLWVNIEPIKNNLVDDWETTVS